VCCRYGVFKVPAGRPASLARRCQTESGTGELSAGASEGTGLSKLNSVVTSRSTLF
jgi:hypothetical protein